ncbi:hypothetical protein HELRODRAFT_182989 [Helobdella robusta]|uniref:Uncharacterized protein n=1 Tax=Helobdella robusta TaxID=6412 RepID=T1FJ22_HELRO|nr:hypothetical protein HELRODRAFT_182989 [Helobdella robusta]ESN89979.1 hypothetical protein HELRODRAFT_182989 [Helobdella robusta]
MAPATTTISTYMYRNFIKEQFSNCRQVEVIYENQFDSAIIANAEKKLNATVFKPLAECIPKVVKCVYLCRLTSGCSKAFIGSSGNCRLLATPNSNSDSVTNNPNYYFQRLVSIAFERGHHVLQQTRHLTV